MTGRRKRPVLLPVVPLLAALVHPVAVPPAVLVHLEVHPVALILPAALVVHPAAEALPHRPMFVAGHLMLQHAGMRTG